MDNIVIIDNEIYKINYLYRNVLGIEYDTTYIDIEIKDFEVDTAKLFISHIFIIYDNELIQYSNNHIDSWSCEEYITTLKMKAYSKYDNKKIIDDFVLSVYKKHLRKSKMKRLKKIMKINENEDNKDR